MKAQTGIWTFKVLGPRLDPGMTVSYVTDGDIWDKPPVTRFAVRPIMETANGYQIQHHDRTRGR
jgi:hypothetical protein